jgi:hypothetical protein
MLILLLLLPDYARFFNIRIEKSPVILLFVVVVRWAICRMAIDTTVTDVMIPNSTGLFLFMI